MNLTSLSKTSFIKLKDFQRKWLLIDAKKQVLGRLASQIAKLLRGKHKAYFSPNINCGDNVIVINAKHIILTGKKFKQKIYYRHSGFPGGIKKVSIHEILFGKYPQRILKLAVKRMLPKESPLARKQLKCFFVYKDEVHPHIAQNPILTKPLKQ